MKLNDIYFSLKFIKTEENDFNDKTENERIYVFKSDTKKNFEVSLVFYDKSPFIWINSKLKSLSNKYEIKIDKEEKITEKFTLKYLKLIEYFSENKESFNKNNIKRAETNKKKFSKILTTDSLFTSRKI